MPCLDYDNSWDRGNDSRKIAELKKRCDKLARIACKSMTALEEMGKEDFLLLRDQEVREWWAQHKEADRKEQARLAEIERQERIKTEALARLSDEEKELLGLKKSTVKKHTKKIATPVPVSRDQMFNELLDQLNKDYDRE